MIYLFIYSLGYLGGKYLNILVIASSLSLYSIENNKCRAWDCFWKHFQSKLNFATNY